MMDIWLGGETGGKGIFDKFLSSANNVEAIMKNYLVDKSYELGFTSLDIIPIIRDDDVLTERKLYSHKKKDMDFRLKIDYNLFKKSSTLECESLIFKLFLRAIDILKTKKLNNDELDRLKIDIENIGRLNNWL
jgi:hypothetical protein